MVEEGLVTWQTFIFESVNSTYQDQEIAWVSEFLANDYLETLLTNVVIHRDANEILAIVNSTTQNYVNRMLDASMTNLASELNFYSTHVQDFFTHRNNELMEIIRGYLMTYYIRIIRHVPNILSDPFSIHYTDFLVSGDPTRTVIRFRIENGRQ